jgi:acyl-CoA reductase-like NAD-dependent aldehyde dehydrogenase
MRPLQAELGGNNAAIVLRDADLDAAARDLAIAMFSFAGQRCTAIRRVIVERPIVGRFTALLCEAVAALKVGPPADPATRVGPVISKARQAALLATIAQAVESGGRVLTGGAAPADCPPQGAWISPTVMTDLPSDSPVLTDELFGPVVALSPAEDLSAALRQHSQYEYGLLGALYSNDKASQARFLAEAQAGLLALNQARPAFASEGPFVGWKASGYGVPEHGRWNRDFYTKVQAVYGAD